MKILTIRHAPTIWNEEKRLQGRTDIALSEKGREKAKSWQIPEEWEGTNLYSSPLLRARETAALLFPGKPAILEPRLVEMDFGAWEGRRLAEIREQDPDAVMREAAGLDFRAPDGESPREVQERLRPFLEEMTGDAIFITHKAVIRALYAEAIGWNMLGKQPHKFQDNCARLFEWDGEKLSLINPNFPL